MMDHLCYPAVHILDVDVEAWAAITRSQERVVNTSCNIGALLSTFCEKL
jgi:hypothetical protein